MSTSPGRSGLRWPWLVVAGIGAVALLAYLVVNGSVRHASCTDGLTTLHLTTSPEKADLLTELAADYRDDNDVCGEVVVTASASGAAARDVACWKNSSDRESRPDVWSPAARTFLAVAQNWQSSCPDPSRSLLPEDVVSDAPSIVQTPLVIAMPRPMAVALGWPEQEIGWSDLLKLAKDPAAWANRGHPEWGEFKLGKTNPNFSTSGLHATIATLFAATGSSSDLTPTDLENPNVLGFARGVESSVVHYGDTTLTFLRNLYDAGTAEGANGLDYISAVTVEEKSVVDFNRGAPEGRLENAENAEQPRVPLAAIYPREGTLISDNPYLVLAGLSERKKEVAADFLEFLRAPDRQREFTDAGFRSYDGEPGEPINQENGLLPDKDFNVLDLPPGPVLAQIPNAWNKVRKHANILLVMDVSGSMNDRVGTNGPSKLDLARQAAGDDTALAQLSPDDQLSLWSFSSEQSGETRPWREQVPFGPLSSVIPQYRAALADLDAQGGTALYRTTRDAQQELGRTLDRSRITAIVVLSDGKNEYPLDNDLGRLLTDLADGDQNSPIRVFPIAYGDQADDETLRKIAQASKGRAYDSTQPQALQQVLVDVLSNF